jgi:hypothetical protein
VFDKMEDLLRCIDGMDRCRYTKWINTMIYLGVLGMLGYIANFGICSYNAPILNSVRLSIMSTTVSLPLPPILFLPSLIDSNFAYLSEALGILGTPMVKP